MIGNRETLLITVIDDSRYCVEIEVATIKDKRQGKTEVLCLCPHCFRMFHLEMRCGLSLFPLGIMRVTVIQSKFVVSTIARESKIWKYLII